MVFRLVAIIATSVAAAVLLDGGWPTTHGPLTSRSASDLLGGMASSALVLLLAWIATAALFDRLRRRSGLLGRLADAAWRLLVPATMRVAATAALGVGAATGVGGVAPALALDAPSPPDSSRPLVDRPHTSASSLPARPSEPAARARVTVVPGDSLWRIAARDLGPTATRPQIAAHWPRWYHANRPTIGPDPDLILVGTRLRPPATEQAPR